ncbi:MAG: ComF family protein [Pirellulales bacterium]
MRSVGGCLAAMFDRKFRIRWRPRLTRLDWRKIGRDWVGSGLNLLFPPQCVACRTPLSVVADGVHLCPKCRELLAPAGQPACARCGARISAVSDPAAGCVRCRGRGLRFEGVISLGTYDNELRSVVLRMKRSENWALSATMGQWLANFQGDAIAAWQPEALVPVPMHWFRRAVRGANSPEILAERLARRLRIPVLPRLLVRRRHTQPQSGLPPGRRFDNVRGVFRIRRGYDVSAARLVLVDDIMTTGATCSEAARVLKAAGAAGVYAAVLARAEGL